MKFLFVLIVVGAIVHNVVAGPRNDYLSNWGETSGINSLVFTRVKSKVAFPLMTRDTDVDFPDVSIDAIVHWLIASKLTVISFVCKQDFDVGPDRSSLVITGIKVQETAKPDCHPPRVNIKKGGIGQRSAKVEVTSDRGCGLNSVISFYVQRPHDVMTRPILTQGGYGQPIQTQGGYPGQIQPQGGYGGYVHNG